MRRPFGRRISGQRSTDPSRRVLGLLVLARLPVITLDARTGADSPLNPVRSAVG